MGTLVTLSVLSMSRHLCILAVLALAAFAAPAHDEHELIEVDNIVPESDLMDASAIQEQFLTIKSMISQGKTKGVADVIQTLIKLVDTEITPSIKQAHDVDQKILRTMMENVQTANNGFSTSVAITQGNANALRKSIQEASHGRPVLLYSQPRIRISPKFGSCRAPSVA